MATREIVVENLRTRRGGSSPALGKAHREIESLKGRLARLRSGADATSSEMINTVVTLGGAFIGAAYDHRLDVRGEARPTSAFGLDWKLTYGTLAHLVVGKAIGGETGRLIKHLSLGLACAGAAAAGVNSRVLLSDADIARGAVNAAVRGATRTGQ